MDTSADLHYRHHLLRLAIQKAPQLSRFLSRQLSERSDAQDLLQELYLRILKLQSHEHIRSPQAYLFRIAANLVFEHRRQCKERPPQIALEDMPCESRQTGADALGEPNAPESAALLGERIEALRARLSDLSPKIQAAIIWHHRDGYTCDEIARRLSVVTHRVKKYLAKGLAHCRDEIGVQTG